MKLNTSPLLIDFLKHIQSELAYFIKTAKGLNSDTLLSDAPANKEWIDVIIEQEESKIQP